MDLYPTHSDLYEMFRPVITSLGATVLVSCGSSLLMYELHIAQDLLLYTECLQAFSKLFKVDREFLASYCALVVMLWQLWVMDCLWKLHVDRISKCFGYSLKTDCSDCQQDSVNAVETRNVLVRRRYSDWTRRMPCRIDTHWVMSFLEFLEAWRRRLRMVKSSGQLAVVEWDDDVKMNPRKQKEKKNIDISRTGSLRFMTNKVCLTVGDVSNGLSSD